MAGEVFSVDYDGLEVGSEIPAEVMGILPGVDAIQASFVLLSATCNPCRELATALEGHHFDSMVIKLLTGREELADGLAPLLPSEFQVLRDPEASQVAAGFQIQSAPFAMTVAEGTVKQKAYLRSKDDLLDLVNGAYDHSLRTLTKFEGE